MRTIKVSEATGHILDWLVAQAEEHDVRILNGDYVVFRNVKGPIAWRWFHPTTNWSQAGEIIERTRMVFDFDEDRQMFSAAYGDVHVGSGPTHLVAAMRCYVASKFGDELEAHLVSPYLKAANAAFPGWQGSSRRSMCLNPSALSRFDGGAHPVQRFSERVLRTAEVQPDELPAVGAKIAAGR